LITCRSNPSAPWPTDPEEYRQIIQQALAGFDAYIEQGLIKDIGFFLDGQLDGYVIVEGDGVEILEGNHAFAPHWLTETREIVPFDQVKTLYHA
jgi:hypothetical protein